MFKIAILSAGALIAAVLGYAATRPDSFQVTRSITIKAKPETIFPYINDFRQWQAWTPYNKDPEMKKTFGDTVTGTGATYAWEGNREVGKGDITIIDTQPPGMVEFELHMIKPFEGRNHVVFTLAAEGDTTRVTWAIDGKNSFTGKLISLFMDVDKMIGTDFEKGLQSLKTVVERNP
ncbi:MAG TPA: SRPBCC family protein [Mariprofundaceae bacterium]|nr:SRPBCC family protein [Mariprofundaceae bacterium]